MNSFIPKQFAGKISFSENEDLSEKVTAAASVISIENILNTLKNSLFESLGQALRIFGGVFAMITVSAVFGIYQKSFGNKFEICQQVCVLCLVLNLFYCMTPIIDNTQQACQNICIVSQSLIASLCSLSVMGGEIIGSVVADSGAMLVISIIQIVCTNFIYPLMRACLVISCCSGLCQSLNLKGVSAFIKSVCSWGLGSMTTLFSCVLLLQKSVTLSADGFNIKLSKFALTSIIPVVGGMVGESLRTVLGSIGVIKSTAGILGISSIIYMVIPPLCAVLIYKLTVLACAFLSRAVGLPKQSELLYEVNGMLNILNSVIICVSLTFIIACAILMKSVNV